MPSETWETPLQPAAGSDTPGAAPDVVIRGEEGYVVGGQSPESGGSTDDPAQTIVYENGSGAYQVSRPGDPDTSSDGGLTGAGDTGEKLLHGVNHEEAYGDPVNLEADAEARRGEGRASSAQTDEDSEDWASTRQLQTTAVVAEQDLLVPVDTVLAGRYVVNGAFPRRSRLTQTYLCTWRGRPYVAKVYEEGSGFSKASVSMLMQLNSPYLARVLKAGRWEEHPFEITTYFRNGSLEGWTFDAETIAQKIVPQLNRGLQALHSRGIVHGNLSPSNVMIGDDPGHYLISDFAAGLAGDPDVENLLEITDIETGPVSFAAPETRTGPPIEASDYYSLGILLFVLYTGQLPVEQPRSFDVYAPRFDYPSDMPSRLRDLIVGLTHTDLSNQDNPANPNRRWTYSEVRRWCAGDSLPVPIESFGPGAAILPYTFEGKQYTSLGALAATMAVNWIPGKNHLFNGLLRRFFTDTDPNTARTCERAELAAKRNPKRADAIYLETLLKLSPDLSSLYWRDEYIGSPEEAGEAFEKGKVSDALEDMALQGALSGYLRARRPDEPDLSRTMRHAEREYINSADKPEERAVASMVIARLLTDDFQYTVDDQNFDDLAEFTAFCLELRQKDRGKWVKLADTLVPGPGQLAPAFEAWLLSLGRADAIESWEGGRAHRTTVEPGSALQPGPDDKAMHEPADEWIV